MDKKKAANEFKDIFKKMLKQLFQVDAKENLSTVIQKLDEPTIEEVDRAVDMLKIRKRQEKLLHNSLKE